jgi:hypothetical protein
VGSGAGVSSDLPARAYLPATQGSTFNRTLWTLIGSAIGDEDRGLHNQGNAGSMFWAPDINEFRDPRWGRGQEVPGEDPTLTSEFAFRYVSALQGGPDDRYKKIVSTCKHFSAYDMENSDGTWRGAFDAQVREPESCRLFLAARSVHRDVPCHPALHRSPRRTWSSTTGRPFAAASSGRTPAASVSGTWMSPLSRAALLVYGSILCSARSVLVQRCERCVLV